MAERQRTLCVHTENTAQLVKQLTKHTSWMLSSRTQKTSQQLNISHQHTSTYTHHQHEMISARESCVIYVCNFLCVCFHFHVCMLQISMRRYLADGGCALSFTGDMGAEPASRSTSRHRCHNWLQHRSASEVNIYIKYYCVFFALSVALYLCLTLSCQFKHWNCVDGCGTTLSKLS